MATEERNENLEEVEETVENTEATETKEEVVEEKTAEELLQEKVDKLEEELKQSEDKYLPVILNSTPYNKSFADILIFSLKNALVNNGFDDLNLNFYFEKAVEMLSNKKFERRFKNIIYLETPVKNINDIHRDFATDLNTAFKTVFKWEI